MYMCVWGINVTSLSTISDSDGVVIKIRKISNVMRTISVVFFFLFAFHFIKIIKTPLLLLLLLLLLFLLLLFNLI